MEINPDHPVTKAIHNDWHKIVALLLHKFGVQQVTFTSHDMEHLVAAFPDMPTVIIREQSGKLIVRLVSLAAAQREAAKEK